MESCIFYQDEEASIILLDIPRSIELAQGTPNCRILSSEALESPFPSVEPRSAKAKANLQEVLIEDLLLQKHLQLALDLVKERYTGEWCLPRLTRNHSNIEDEKRDGKRRRTCEDVTRSSNEPSQKTVKGGCGEYTTLTSEVPYLTQNTSSSWVYAKVMSSNELIRMPPNSSGIGGDINETLKTFSDTAPKFDLIVLDPPWPNRSARRKQSYGIAYSTTEIHNLLSSIPIQDHLAEDGLVAVWVTNKPVFQEILLQEGGLFDEWGIELIEKVVWLKVTIHGDPICQLDSVWRKPYEILFVGRKKRQRVRDFVHVKTRILIGVPDMHSRKPNLESVFASKVDNAKILGLEIFARNLTAGWWAWGNEVFKYQDPEYWHNEDHH
jgi:N6-adenosine-specific RNA methylase IME4